MIQTLVGLGASILAPSIMKRLKDQKVQVVHAMPGRVRLQSNHWKEEKIAHALEEHIRFLPLVKTVKASGITGSLLMEFHSSHLTPEQFDEIVQFAVHISTQTYAEMDSKMKKTMKKGVHTVDHLIKKQTGGESRR
ncbi:hypothetical protein QTG56_22085 [Rossellomorea sp. AcN35-11]|nr:hypothetical protein QTG56_22085 [Rossellomorea sp. AcN35-11]